MTGAMKSSPINDLQVKCGDPPLHLRRQFFSNRFVRLFCIIIDNAICSFLQLSLRPLVIYFVFIWHFNNYTGKLGSYNTVGIMSWKYCMALFVIRSFNMFMKDSSFKQNLFGYDSYNLGLLNKTQQTIFF